MPKLTMEAHDPNQYKTLPVDTIVQLEVVNIDEREVKSAKGDWMKLEFKFNILEIPDALSQEFGEVIGTPIWGSVGARFSEHPDNKLKKWAEALFGVDLNVGYELDTDDLLGKKCRGAISQYKKRDGGMSHQVAELFPISGYSTSAPTTVIKEDPWLASEGTQELATAGATQSAAAQSALAAFDDEPPF